MLLVSPFLRRILFPLIALAVLAGCGSTQESASPTTPEAPESPTPKSPTSDPGGSVTEAGLTRIVAMNWGHKEVVEGGLPRLRVIEAGDEQEVEGLAVAVGGEAVDGGRVLDAGGPHDVRADRLNAEVFRVVVQERVTGLASCRPLRLEPDDILPLTTVEVGPGERIVTGRVEPNADRAVGVLFRFSEATSQIIEDAASQRLQVQILGDLIVDINGRALDAEFVRGDLPTGDRPRGSETGIQGGTFRSWFSVRQ